LTYALVGISMALSGYSYWSLVAAQLASSVVVTVAICALTRYVPPIVPSLHGVKDLFYFGAGITGTGLLNYIAQKADYLVVGRWLNSTALGLYTRAFNITHYPWQIFSGILYPILFSTFSHLQEDSARARAAFGYVITGVALLTFPALALFAVAAPEFIPFVFGKQWTGAVVSAQILSFAGMLRAIANPGAALVVAFGKVYAQMWRQGTYAVVLAGAAMIGTRWGIVGVSWGALVATTTIWLLNAHLVFLCSGFGVGDYAHALRGPVLVAGTVLLLAAQVRTLASAAGLDALLVLLIAVATGLIAGSALTVLVPFPECRSALTNFARVMRREPEAHGYHGPKRS